MPLAQLNGIELYYEVHGEAGETIVFAHGRGGNHMSWWRQVAELSRGYRCVTFDHRSFGMSRRPADAAGQEAFADDLLALLDHLGVARAHLVAQSMGGRTCLDLALAHPERVCSVTLADTIAGVVDPELSQLVAALGPAPKDLMPRVLSAGFRMREPQLAFLYEEMEALNHVWESPIKLQSQGPGKAELQSCRLPFLLVVGDQDPLVSVEAAAWMARQLPQARMEVIVDAGHSAYYERPDVFNHLLRGFFASATK
jgi:3-oxoadipate enol-lactonase